LYLTISEERRPGCQSGRVHSKQPELGHAGTLKLNNCVPRLTESILLPSSHLRPPRPRSPRPTFLSFTHQTFLSVISLAPELQADRELNPSLHTIFCLASRLCRSLSISCTSQWTRRYHILIWRRPSVLQNSDYRARGCPDRPRAVCPAICLVNYQASQSD
jgi:hypothetical protein